jgi:SsrA-binding protein
MIQNRKAYHDYFIGTKYTAGIVLFGPEVKSIRKGDASITEAYCYINNGEVFIKGMHVKAYEHSLTEFDTLRDRKLLLNKKEIYKLIDELKETGKTLVPLVLHQGNRIKIEIGVGKGKKDYDKRNTLKERDIDKKLRQYR